MDQVTQLDSKMIESQNAIMALAQEATSMAEKREWLEGNLRNKADRSDTEALWYAPSCHYCEVPSVQ